MIFFFFCVWVWVCEVKGPKICDALRKPRLWTVYKSTSRLIFTRPRDPCHILPWELLPLNAVMPRFVITWRVQVQTLWVCVLLYPKGAIFDPWMSESSDEDIAEKKTNRWQLCGIELGNLRLEFLGPTKVEKTIKCSNGRMCCNFCEMSFFLSPFLVIVANLGL